MVGIDWSVYLLSNDYPERRSSLYKPYFLGHTTNRYVPGKMLNLKMEKVLASEMSRVNSHDNGQSPYNSKVINI